VITGAQPDEVKQAEALESLFSAQGFKAISITTNNKANERQARGILAKCRA
jgi:ABC-type sugar transport system substrate-binding protein